jgi:hypothetical protein
MIILYNRTYSQQGGFTQFGLDNKFSAADLSQSSATRELLINKNYLGFYGFLYYLTCRRADAAMNTQTA